jgi:putative colanic acid biosynthesis UDP-glucose lipid carrier transferase
MVYRVEHDLEYIRRWSLWFDLQILWLTAFGRRVRSNAY